MMRTPFLLLKFVGKALLNVVGGGIAGDLLIDTLPDMAGKSGNGGARTETSSNGGPRSKRLPKHRSKRSGSRWPRSSKPSCRTRPLNST